jgi:organic radical activating enzyme
MSKSNFMSAAEKMKELLGPGLCLAKWKQVSLHLATGMTNSCYHPPLHEIDPTALKDNPGALHNTAHKKAQRVIMLKNERPAECNYCWTQEDMGNLSDRHYRSGEPWAANDYNAIRASTGEEDWIPSYVEVNFNHVCNLKCSYCSPQFSSTWMQETDYYGAYPTSTAHNDPAHFSGRRRPIPSSYDNPYVDAFWQWWPSIYNSLEILRITGGEPLLTKNTFKVLDYIIENPKPQLELNINSNLCVPDKIFDQFINKIKFIQENKLVKSFKLYTSVEAYGEQAEYIRFGLDYKSWRFNCNRILKEIPDSKLTVMSTYNALSVTSYLDFLKDWNFLRKDHNKRNLSLDISYLRWPHHQNIFVLDQSFIKYLDNQLAYMKSEDFFEHEIHRFERIYTIFKDHIKKDQYVEQNQKDFAAFVKEHDKRRGTNFQNTFPEMNDFLQKCKML